MTDVPAQILSRLFLSMFSSDELRRLLRYGFPDALSQALPGVNASAVALADAASEEIVRRGELETLWPLLIAERPRRRTEIEAARDRISAQAPARNEPTGSIHGPIRILFVLSCPRTQERLATEEEIRQIRAELDSATHRERFSHEVILAATYTDLRKALRKHRPHILHIACHGTPEEELILDDGRQGEERIDAETFIDLLDVLKEDLRLVVLNACHSAAITHRLAALVNLVVGMRGAVGDSSAVAFAQVFYESLASGDSVERSFRLGVNELRRRKAESNIPELLPAEGAQRQFKFAAA